MNWTDYIIIAIVIIIAFVLLATINRKSAAIFLGTIVGIIVVLFLKHQHTHKAIDSLITEGTEKVKNKAGAIVEITTKKVANKRKEIENAKRKDIIDRFIFIFGGESK